MDELLFEEKALRQLVLEWKLYNHTLFKGRMRLPLFELSSSASYYGRWSPDTRRLEISKDLIMNKSWPQVIEVLKHEMAHQFVNEVLGVFDETAHGASFLSVCKNLGLDAKAAGLPSKTEEQSERAKNISSKVTKLLSLAQSSNSSEAENAMLAAQRLMLKHRDELRLLSSHYGVKHLGEASGKINEPMRLLASILVNHFDVECIWIPVYLPASGKKASMLEICGREEQLEIAEYVHGFLWATAERLWREHRTHFKTASVRDKLVYLSGVFQGFDAKLKNQSKTILAESGLVHVKDADLIHFFKSRYPRVRTVRYQGERKTASFEQGKKAGAKIVLSKPLSSSTQKRGFLLAK